MTTDTSSLSCVVLAAGSGTRMKSSLPKPLHQVAGQPMLQAVLSAVQGLEPLQVAVVVGPTMQGMDAYLVPPLVKAIQNQPKGTGDAVRAGVEALVATGQPLGDVVVVFGDAPLVRTETLQALIERRRAADNPAIVVSGFLPPNPTGYGRLVCDAQKTLLAIVEERDATPAQKDIKRCNGGVMVFDGALLSSLLAALQPNNAKGELYLTDCIALAHAQGRVCAAVDVPAEDMLGVNTRAELAVCEGIMQSRLRARALEAGVTLQDPATTFFSFDTQLAADVIVGPCVVFGSHVVVEEGAEIRAFSHLEGASIGKGAIVGPYARVRPTSRVEAGAMVGNFVELKNAHLGEGAKASHLTYLGDASVGPHANIGAGTITCNYDGFSKFKTSIGAGAFIGSNTALVAPVTVGDGALVGAGSVIVQDVPANALALARAPQQHAVQKGMATRRKERQ